MKSLAMAAALALVATGCRTNLKATQEQKTNQAYVSEQRCDVFDYALATEVPTGAKNLGWVQVKDTGNDEETFAALRQKICEMGGDALSGPHWERKSGEDPVLKANAWSLP
jgi:hypothetical protein